MHRRSASGRAKRVRRLSRRRVPLLRPAARVIAGLDEDEREIYVGTLIKALFPNLRLGYAVVPRRYLRLPARAISSIGSPQLHHSVAEFMKQGHFAAHIRHMRQMHRKQHDALAATLSRYAGGHLDVEVPRPRLGVQTSSCVPPRAVVRRAAYALA